MIKNFKFQISNYQKVVWLFAFLFIYLLRLQFLPHLNLQDGQLISVTGALTEEPQVFGSRQSFKIGQFEVWTEKFPEYHYGDWLEIIGKVKVVPTKSRLAESYLLNFPEISPNGAGAKGITGLAIGLKNRLKGVFLQSLPSPLDGILAGIVLGDKSLIPPEFWGKLKLTGTLHIMVASGMNIAMFSGTVLAFLTLFFKRRTAIVFLFLVIWFYSLMTGLQSPIIRAAIMASLVYLSQFFGREAEGGRVLWLTGGMMLLLNPLWLFDVGFQLSFLATAGLVYLQPRLQKYSWLRQESISSSLAAQLATLPVLVSSFGQLNLISPLTNLAVLWCVPFVLQLGIVIGLAGLLWQSLGQALSYLALPFLIFIKQTVDWSAKMTLFQTFLPEIKWFWWLGYYCLIAWWVKKSRTSSVKSKEVEICGRY